MAAGARPASDSSPTGICPVLVGTTAVGKTALIVEAAQRFPLDVISLDSRQLYRGMRIGTAQPSDEERNACPHHLIDFVSPATKYSAARYRRDFERVYREIQARGRLPVLVGGAGLYLTALREGLFDLPGISGEDTARVRSELDLLDDEEIHRQLRDLDPESCTRIHPHDRYRCQRAVEIYLLAGRPMSALMREQKPRPALNLDFPTVFLQRTPAETALRILTRTTAMLAAGWVEETTALLQEYGPEAPGLVTIGYREIVVHLQGDLPRDELVEQIVSATRQYAKRQRTWFRHTPVLATGDPEDPRVQETVAKMLQRAQADGHGQHR